MDGWTVCFKHPQGISAIYNGSYAENCSYQEEVDFKFFAVAANSSRATLIVFLDRTGQDSTTIEERMEPVGCLSSVGGNDDQAIRPKSKQVERIVHAIGIGKAVAVRNAIAFSSGAHPIECRPDFFLYMISFAKRPKADPWSKRLQSEMRTAFLATRRITEMTESGCRT